MARPQAAPLPALLAAPLGLSLLFASVAAAQTAPDTGGDFRPHRGLYVNAQTGLGDLRFAVDGGHAPGRSYVLALDIGVAAARNLVVYGELYDAHVDNPKFDSAVLDEVGVRGFGGGAKIYLAPSNLFIAGSLVAAQLHGSGAIDSFDPTPPSETVSHWGLAGRLLVGREWWATPNVSFGLAGELLYGRMGNNPPANSLESKYDYVVKGASLLLSTTVSVPSSPEPEPAPDGAHTHDGLYLNVRAGVGWLGLNGTTTISGVGVPLGISAGFAIRTNLVLFGEYDWAYVSAPSSDFGVSRMDLRGFGPGVAYYLEPPNIFLSGSLLLSRFDIASHTPDDTRYGIDMTSRWGPSARLSVGREWWISRDWGLGLAAEFLLGRMRESFPGQDDPYVAKALSLLASATLN